MRLEPDQHGKRHLRFWKVFCLKALAGTRFVSETLEDRCIVFPMTQNTFPIQPLDETAACVLRGKLAAWRSDFIKQPTVSTVSTVSTVIPSTTTPTNEMNDDTLVTDERLKELYNPLLGVCQEKRLKRLIRLKRLENQKQWNDEARLSLDADVLQAISGVAKPSGRFTSGSVTDTVNVGRREDELIAARTVGWIIRRLGFRKAPKIEGGQCCWWFDMQLWVKRAKQFGYDNVVAPLQSLQTNPQEASV